MCTTVTLYYYSGALTYSNSNYSHVKSISKNSLVRTHISPGTTVHLIIFWNTQTVHVIKNMHHIQSPELESNIQPPSLPSFTKRSWITLVQHWKELTWRKQFGENKKYMQAVVKWLSVTFHNFNQKLINILAQESAAQLTCNWTA